MKYDAVAVLELNNNTMRWRVAIQSGSSIGTIGLCSTARDANQFVQRILGDTAILIKSTDSERCYMVR